MKPGYLETTAESEYKCVVTVNILIYRINGTGALFKEQLKVTYYRLIISL